MFTTLKLMTATALLVHSIFGCGVWHACGCWLHGMSEHRVCDEMECDPLANKTSGHSRSAAHADRLGCCNERHAEDRGSDAKLSVDVTSIGADCSSCEHQGHPPACLKLHCRFTMPRGIAFPEDAERRLAVMAEYACWSTLPMQRLVSRSVRVIDRPCDAHFMRILHCRWQI